MARMGLFANWVAMSADLEAVVDLLLGSIVRLHVNYFRHLIYLKTCYIVSNLSGGYDM